MIPPSLAKLFEIIPSLRIVGGASRDIVLYGFILDDSDIDLTTMLTPSKLLDCLIAHKIYIEKKVMKYGVITIIIDNCHYEIASTRRDIKCYGRHADVEFGCSYEEDSQRRDFTINAIYIDEYGNIEDFHNGVSDLMARKIRFIGDPATRIKEDRTRVDRFFRFLAQYEATSDQIDVVRACVARFDDSY